MSFKGKKTKTIACLIRRFKVIRHSGFKYLLKTDRQIYNRHNSCLYKRKITGRSNHRKKKDRILRRDGRQCQICRQLFPPQQLTIDHIKPRRDGGSNSMKNLRLLCEPCHTELNRRETTHLS